MPQLLISFPLMVPPTFFYTDQFKPHTTFSYCVWLSPVAPPGVSLFPLASDFHLASYLASQHRIHDSFRLTFNN